MAEFFAERMRYFLSEMTSLAGGDVVLTPNSEIVKKVVASLDEFQSALGDELRQHDRNVRKVEEAVSWMGELEETSFAAEDALGKWRVKFGELATRETQMNVKLALITVQCCIPVCCWAFAAVDASTKLEGYASSMETQVETLLLKGKKLVAKLKSGNFPQEGDDPGLMVSSVREGDKNLLLEHLLSRDNSFSNRVHDLHIREFTTRELEDNTSLRELKVQELDTKIEAITIQIANRKLTRSKYLKQNAKLGVAVEEFSDSEATDLDQQ